MYLKRHNEQKLRSAVNHFKVVMVTGARQVGKSTLLSHLFPNIKTFVFDPLQDLYGAKNDPDLFLNNFHYPLILDEVQYVPELLPALKRRADQTEAKGQYLLTGSQNLSMLKNVAESMAGRVGIIHLEGMSPYEKAGIVNHEAFWLEEYLIDPKNLIRKFQKTLSEGVFQSIWRGGLPGMLNFDDSMIPTYFSSYIQTYLDRDVRLVENIKDLTLFNRFLGLTAAYTGQEINYSQFGREIGVSSPTAERWLSLLKNTYQWREISPYSGNTIKRLSKKSKGYLTDTGLSCYLQRISSPEALASHPLLGGLFETMVVNTIYCLSESLNVSPQFYHWRSSIGAEVDLILERDGHLYPIEIKCKTVLKKRDLSGLQAFRDTYPNHSIMPGLVIYAGTECYPLDDQTIALPWNTILQE